jgi:hypothetical protein
VNQLFLRTGRKLRTGRWPPKRKVLCESVVPRTGRKLRTGRWPPVGKILCRKVFRVLGFSRKIFGKMPYFFSVGQVLVVRKKAGREP